MTSPLPSQSRSGRPSLLAGEAGEATRGSAVKLAAEAAGRLLSLTTTLAIARGLGVEGFGRFAATSGLAVVLAELSDLGLQATAARALVAGTLPLAALVRARLALGAALGLAALAASFPAPLLSVLMVYFGLAGWSEFLGVALRAHGRRVQEAVLILTLRASSLVLVAGALLSGGGVFRVALALAASPLAAILAGVVLVRRAYGASAPASAPSVATVIRTSAPLGINNALAIGSLRLETLALAGLRGPAEAGLYAAALRVVEFALLVPAAISAGAMPALTREAIRHDGPVRQRTITTVALLGLPASAGLFLLAPTVVPLLFGPSFTNAGGTLRLLALALVPLFLNAALLHGLIAAGRAPWLPRLTAVRLALAVLLVLALVPRYGPLGAAAGFLAAEATLFALAHVATAAAGFPMHVLRPLALASLLSLPMVAVVGLAAAFPVAAVAAGLVCYLVTATLALRLGILDLALAPTGLAVEAGPVDARGSGVKA